MTRTAYTRTTTTALLLTLSAAFPHAAAAQERDSVKREPTEAEMQRMERELMRRRMRVEELRGTMSVQAMARCDDKDRPEGWLGISFESTRSTEMRRGGPPVLRLSGPIQVDAVAPESPAAKAGLQVGDSITVINGELVSGRDLVLAPLLKPGLSLPMKYRRGGKEREISVAITKRPGMFGDPCGDIAVRVMRGPGGTSTVEFFPDSLMVSGGPRPGARVVRIPRPPSTPRAPDGVTVEWSGPTAPSGNFFSFERMPAVIAGAELRKLSTDLADVLGVEKGIFVVSVAPRSPAEEGGVRGGDVIVKAGDTEVTTTRELSMAVGKADHRITLEIIRKRKPITLSLTW